MGRYCGCLDIDDDTAKCGGGFCFGVLFIVSIILFSVSFGTLSPTEVGVRYNNNLVSINEDRVFNNGRYFLGLGIWFIKYPITMRTMDFNSANSGEYGSLKVWSQEGQLLNVDATIYFRLDRDQIINIYRRYYDSWFTIYSQIAVRAIKAVTIQYTSVEFFTRRVDISRHIKQFLRARLKQEFATVELVNLRRIALPANFSQKIIDKVVQRQLHQTALEIMQTQILRANVQVITATGDATVNYTLAAANANAERTIQNAVSLGQQRLREQEAISYKALQTALGLSSPELLKYRWAQIMEKLEKDAVQNKDRTLQYLVGFKSASIKVSP